MNRCILIVALFFLCEICVGFSEKSEAEIILTNAIKKANIENKEVFILFEGSGDPWSVFFRDCFFQPGNRILIEKKYVICELFVKPHPRSNFKETPGSYEIFQKYYTPDSILVRNSSSKWPAVVIINSNWNKVAQCSGFSLGKSGIDRFVEILNLNISDKRLLNKTLLNDYCRVSAPCADSLMKEAEKLAKAEGKNIIVHYGASWCHWCHAMDSAFNHSLSKEVLERKFVMVYLKVFESTKHLMEQNPGGNEMLLKYTKDRSGGIPVTMIFDSDGQFLAEFNGFQFPGRPENWIAFEQALRGSGSFSDSEMVNIRAAFTAVGKKNGL